MKKLFAVIALLLIVSPIYAQQISSADVLIDLSTGSVRQTVAMHFAQNVSGELNYTLDGRTNSIVVSDGTHNLKYTTKESDGEINLTIETNNTDTVIIDYNVDGVVFSSGPIYHFFTELSFDTGHMSVSAKLPEGYGLYESNDLLPAGGQILSDGKRILVDWNSLPGNAVFSIKFTKIGGQDFTMPIIVVVLGLAVVGIYLYFSRRMYAEFLSGFREDEKKVIEYMAGGMKMQRDVQKKFNFSRAKATRIVHVLEGKGLLAKRRYGRTNKLYWTKKSKIPWKK
jgi:uncharacterized membrane protein